MVRQLRALTGKKQAESLRNRSDIAGISRYFAFPKIALGMAHRDNTNKAPITPEEQHCSTNCGEGRAAIDIVRRSIQTLKKLLKVNLQPKISFKCT